jgi:transposase
LRYCGSSLFSHPLETNCKVNIMKMYLPKKRQVVQRKRKWQSMF